MPFTEDLRARNDRDLAQIQQFVTTDPVIQQILQEAKAKATGPGPISGSGGANARVMMEASQKIDARLKETGHNVTGLHIGGLGDVRADETFPWAQAIITGLLAFGGTAALGASLAAAPTAAASVPVAGGSAVPAASAAVTDLTIPGTVAGPGAAAITSGGLGTLGRVGQIAGALGRGSGAATQAAGQNRINADDTAMQAQRDYENELQSRATTDASQRKSALQDVYRQSFFSTPQNSPYDTRGVTPPSADYLNTLSMLEKQALLRLQNPSPYNMNTVPPLTPYKPKKPSTLEQIGTWASPALSTLSNVAGLF